jgi:hypothetical protein
MARSDDDAALERARREILSIAAEFREAAAPAVREMLRRRLDALIEARRAWWGGLDGDVQDAFRSAASRAIAAGEAETRRRLEAEDVWLQPLVAPGMDERTSGWDTSLPEWVTSLIQRFSPKTRGPEVDALDDPGNRIWLSLMAAARPLDPVFEEFGLEGSAAPSLGGGRYGLQPKTAEQLDPSGELARLWRRYRLAHRRYEALASAGRPA